MARNIPPSRQVFVSRHADSIRLYVLRSVVADFESSATGSAMARDAQEHVTRA